MKTYIHFRPIPTTLEDLKAAYKRLAIANHPDHGGSTETMQQINAEYTDLFEQLKNTHRNAAGEQYTSRDTTDEAPAEFIELIEKLIRIPGIIIELCGSWLWITGDTKPVKDELKTIGFRWSSSKTAWYYHRGGYHKRSGKECTMDEIRNMYGSQQYTGSQRNQLQEVGA
jgi:curved DNA-binding protein CbpA